MQRAQQEPTAKALRRAEGTWISSHKPRRTPRKTPGVFSRPCAWPGNFWSRHDQGTVESQITTPTPLQQHFGLLYALSCFMMVTADQTTARWEAEHRGSVSDLALSWEEIQRCFAVERALLPRARPSSRYRDEELSCYDSNNGDTYSTTGPAMRSHRH